MFISLVYPLSITLEYLQTSQHFISCRMYTLTSTPFFVTLYRLGFAKERTNRVLSIIGHVFLSVCTQYSVCGFVHTFSYTAGILGVIGT